MRARFYNPAIGRFINADPLEGRPSAPQSLNRYAYALNNPTNRVDPTGLDSEFIPRACIELFITSFLFLASLVISTYPFGAQITYSFTLGLVIGLQFLEAIHEAEVTGQAVSSLDLAAAIRSPILPAAIAANIPSLVYDFIQCAEA